MTEVEVNPNRLMHLLSLYGMTKAELLADSVNTINLVHKASASKSKVQHYIIQSKEDYDRLIRSMGQEPAT